MSDSPAAYVALATNYVLGANNHKILAQVTIVDWRGQTCTFLSFYSTFLTDFMSVLDVYVHPTAPVVDYRTVHHGLDQRHINAPEARLFEEVRINAMDIIHKAGILVGHCLWQSVALLNFTHPVQMVRDVATYTPFRRALGYPLDSCSTYPLLKDLMQVLMLREIEPLFYNTTESARAAMDLYRSHMVAWEGVIATGGWPSVVLPAYWNGYFT